MDRTDQDLLHRHLNGDLDAAETASFFARVRDSADLRRALAERAIDESLLSEIVLEGRVRATSKRRVGWPAIAAAAVMLIGLVFLLYRGADRPNPRLQGSPQPVDPALKEEARARVEIEQVVRRACQYLESRKADLFVALEDGQRHHAAPRRTYAELAALALISAGYKETHPLVDELVGRALGRPLESSYAASIRAVLLSELNPSGRLQRLRECAQFLVDSQCPNGQWDYGRAIKVDDVPPAGVIRRRHDGPPSGDNSVTAYAVLGLLACKHAGVDIEPDVLDRVRRWWLSCQNADGGWGYRDAKQPRNVSPMLTSDTSYGSATASGVAALAALREMIGPDAAADQAIRRGQAWLGGNFSADANPGKAAGFSHVHWLAGASRAASLLGVDRFGTHDWYAEGARFLLSRQKPSGEWNVEGDFMKAEKNDIVDTCLAILFLTRKG